MFFCLSGHINACVAKRVASIWEMDGRDGTFLKGPDRWLYTKLKSILPSARMSMEISNFLDVGQDKKGLSLPKDMDSQVNGFCTELN